MGLDMYLHAHFTFNRWDLVGDKQDYNALKVKMKEMQTKLFEIMNINLEEEKRISTDLVIGGLILDVGYWRKANHIHKWFMDQREGDEGNYDKIEINKTQLLDLKDRCEKVLNQSISEKSNECYSGETLKNGNWEKIPREGEIITNPEIAEKLLPTKSGFFFGSTEYDDHYLEDIKYTLEILKAAIPLAKNGATLIYSASW